MSKLTVPKTTESYFGTIARKIKTRFRSSLEDLGLPLINIFFSLFPPLLGVLFISTPHLRSEVVYLYVTTATYLTILVLSLGSLWLLSDWVLPVQEQSDQQPVWVRILGVALAGLLGTAALMLAGAQFRNLIGGIFWFMPLLLLFALEIALPRYGKNKFLFPIKLFRIWLTGFISILLLRGAIESTSLLLSLSVATAITAFILPETRKFRQLGTFIGPLVIATSTLAQIFPNSFLTVYLAFPFILARSTISELQSKLYGALFLVLLLLARLLGW